MSSNAFDFGENLFLDFAGMMLRWFRAISSREEVPRITRVTTVFGNNGYTHATLDSPAPGWMRQRVKQPDSPVPGSTEGQRLLDHILARKLTLPSNLVERDVIPELFKNDTLDYLIGTVCDVIDKTGTLKPTKSQLLRQYHTYLQRFRSPAIWGNWPLFFLAPLVNIETPISGSRFGPVQFDSLSPEVKNQIWDKYAPSGYPFFESIRFQGILASNWCLRGEGQAAFDTIENLLTAMRLHKSGAVGIVGGAFLNLHWGGNIVSKPDWDATQRVPYMLDRKDLPNVRKILKALTSIRDTAGFKDVQVAVRRLHQSYNRQSLEDRLVDATVALESLLVGPDSKTEIGYKFALRGAGILSRRRNPIDCKTLFTELYNTRSKIVHAGEDFSSPSKDLKKSMRVLGSEVDGSIVVETVENVLRDVLQEMVFALSAGRTRKNVIDDVENRFLRIR